MKKTLITILFLSLLQYLYRLPRTDTKRNSMERKCDMKEQFFKWEEFAQEHNGIDFPVEAIQEVFLMDVEENRVWLSKKLSQLL